MYLRIFYTFLLILAFQLEGILDNICITNEQLSMWLCYDDFTPIFDNQAHLRDNLKPLILVPQTLILFSNFNLSMPRKIQKPLQALNKN